MPPYDPVLEPPEDIPAVSAEELVDGRREPAAASVAPGPDHGPATVSAPEPRRYPSTIGGMFYLGVLAAALTGLAWVTFGSWRTGIRVVGGSLIFAAAVRVVLTARNAGMLAVRHKIVDVLLLAGVGAALVFLATSIPNQPG